MSDPKKTQAADPPKKEDGKDDKKATDKKLAELKEEELVSAYLCNFVRLQRIKY